MATAAAASVVVGSKAAAKSSAGYNWAACMDYQVLHPMKLLEELFLFAQGRLGQYCVYCKGGDSSGYPHLWGNTQVPITAVTTRDEAIRQALNLACWLRLPDTILDGLGRVEGFGRGHVVQPCFVPGDINVRWIPGDTYLYTYTHAPNSPAERFYMQVGAPAGFEPTLHEVLKDALVLYVTGNLAQDFLKSLQLEYTAQGLRLEIGTPTEDAV